VLNGAGGAAADGQGHGFGEHEPLQDQSHNRHLATARQCRRCGA
jgi:hypothetical protein